MRPRTLVRAGLPLPRGALAGEAAAVLQTQPFTPARARLWEDQTDFVTGAALAYALKL
jgi:hypothetical protein